MAILGVGIALAGNATDVSPTWTRIDDPAGVNVVTSWEIERGRRGEREQTGPGKANVTLRDLTGAFDPTNTTGAYYGQLRPGRQAGIALQNPVTSAWSTLFRGHVENL